MSMKLKQFILGIPLVGPAVSILKQISVLPERQQDQESRLHELEQDSKAGLEQIAAWQAATDKQLKESLSFQESRYENIKRQLTLIDRHMRQSSTGKDTVAHTSKQDTFAEDHLLDVFYTDFEDRFRGSEKTIIERLKEYVPYFTNSNVDFKKNPVLDIGSGRGEMLQILKDNKINSFGLDINLDMVERASKKGLKAKQGDALDFLENAKPKSYGAITGFHIVEHIPFGSLLRIFKAAHEALADDGFVIFETPNPENIFVSTLTFYLDPSHLHPLPPDLLAFAFEVSDFRKVEILRLHPDEPHETNLPKELADRFYGARDYAVLAYK